MNRSRWLPLYPFLFALYFVMTLAEANIGEFKSLADLREPIALSVGVCTVCWLVGFAITRHPHKAAALALVWFVAFAVYGYVTESLRASGTLMIMGGDAIVRVLFAVALVGLSLAISRSARRLEPISVYLSLVGLVLIGFTTAQLLRGLSRETDVRVSLAPSAISAAPWPSGEAPDIFLIVLDKYTGGQLLRDHFEFDNGEFEDWLRSQGFVVPRAAKANYPQTSLALASLLNLDYLHNLPPELRLGDLVEHNRLVAFLKERGYRFVFFPSAYRITFQNRNADLQLPLPKQVRSEFGAVWQNTTMLPELLGGACGLIGCNGGRFLLKAQTAEDMNWKFERLAELAGGDQPAFVLAHLSLPHEPYIYHADCTPRIPYWPASAGLLGDDEATRGYLDQIRCANRKLAALVDAIMARSSREAVILLQADHGHGRIGALRRVQKISPRELRERMSVFAAYRLPGVDGRAIGDSITPVNAVRLVLRHYFGADLPALEDASYWGLQDEPRDLVRVAP
ncbi:MAG TPA: hypothetical protein VIQ27_03495 [Gemmatimonadales bacterium]|jgi:Sulfatase.